LTKQTPEELLSTLSEREMDVLKLYCQHKTQRKIASELYISKNTVKTHMSNICEKLEITTSDAGERKLIFFNTFCPLISADKAQKPQKDKTPEIKEPQAKYGVEEKTTEKQEEKKEEPIADPKPNDQDLNNDGGNEKMAEKKKRGCARFIITLILGALIVIGAWYSWENYLKDMPIVQNIVQLINPDVVIESSPSSPSSSSSSSSNSSNSSSSDSETIIEKILPKTDPYADAIAQGDWAKQNDVWVRLFDYEVSRGLIRLDFEVWNKSSKDIFFSWEAEKNFSMTDNKGNRYEIFTDNPREVQVASGERLEITGYGYETVSFEDDPLYTSGVTDLYVKMEYFSTIDEAIFHIVVGN